MMDSRDYPEAYLFEEGANITLERSERYARKLEAENAKLREELAAVQKDAERYRGLREMCGYVEDGSSQSVSIGQDDATRNWILKIGRRQWYAGTSFGSAIDEAMKEQP